MPSLVARGHVYGFPETMAAGDFDADGRDDLALASIGGPRADTAGSITVLYGSPAGLTAARAQTWSQDSVGIAAIPEASEWFGRGLAVGSFGLDSCGREYDDLAVGVGESVDAVESGGVHIIFGGPLGLTGSSSQFWSQSSIGVPGVSEEGDVFGGALVAADFGRNPRRGAVDDLAILSDSEATSRRLLIFVRTPFASPVVRVTSGSGRTHPICQPGRPSEVRFGSYAPHLPARSSE